MPRQPRIQLEDAFYHVFHRGNRREPLFLDEADYARFERYLFAAALRSGILLFDWSLIPNHFHLVIQTPRGNIAELMRRLLTRYAMYFNWKYKSVGHVFQGRYGSRLCNKEEYFLALIAYVELNPYRISEQHQLATLGQWKWTALRFLMGRRDPPDACREAFQQLLERFGQNPDEARTQLAKYLSDQLNKGEWEAFYQPGKYGLLGDEGFEQEVNARLQRPLIQTTIWPDHFNGLLEMAEACFKVSRDLLQSASENRALSRIRQALIEVGRLHCRFATRDIAAGLHRSSAAISMAICRGQQRPGLQETNRLLIWVRGAGEV